MNNSLVYSYQQPRFLRASRTVALQKSLQKGFTLLELMVVILLLAIVSVLSWQGLHVVSSQGQQLEQVADHLKKEQLIFEQFQHDLSRLIDTQSAQLGNNAFDFSEKTDELRIILLRDTSQTEQATQIQRIEWIFTSKNISRIATPIDRDLQVLAKSRTVKWQYPLDSWAVQIYMPEQGWLNLNKIPKDKPLTSIPTGLKLSIKGSKSEMLVRFFEVHK